ncbi:MAG: hypothetical protein K2X41_06835 [Hyphomicrobium sp.]|nr:hypothetical protein [Hyphomicrobium sp.]
MATDYAEKERQFVDTLSQDTGKDLHGWMLAISAEKLANRNDIIDWLRHQGFQFAKASWLERIHHNGGRLIYAEDAPALAHRAPLNAHANEMLAGVKPIGARVDGVSSVDALPATTTETAKIEPVLATLLPFRGQAAPRLLPSADVIAILALAKGLRPLAELIVREITRVAPGVVMHARAPLIIAAAPQPFLALWPGPKLLRLYGNFGSPTAGATVRPAEAVMKAPAPFPHMIALDDARLIDADFKALIESALARAAAP